MKDSIRRQLEGSVSVDADATITPITRKPIKNVDAINWSEMNLTELYDQLATLDDRRIKLYEIGQPAVAQQVELGIARLQLIIKSKTDGMPRLM